MQGIEDICAKYVLRNTLTIWLIRTTLIEKGTFTMSFEAVPPSTAVLNGYNDEGEFAANAYAAGEAQATANAKAAKATTKKATTAKAKASTNPKSDVGTHGSGSYSLYTNPPTVPIQTAEQILAQSGISSTPTVDSQAPDIIFIVIIPIIIIAGMIWGFFHLMIKSIQKHPAYGGFSHKHKKHHPGKMNPRIFR